MESLAGGEAAVNTDEVPVMGSSEHSAQLRREASAAEIGLRLSCAQGDLEATLDLAAFDVGQLVGQGLDPAYAADILRWGALACGLVATRGEDWVQGRIAAGFDDGRALEDEQMEADAEAEKSDLERMNERFAVVRIGGKTRVMEFQESPARRGAFVPVYSAFRDFRDFHNKYRVRIVDDEGEVRWIGLGSWWLEHRERQQYTAVVYEPGAGDTGDALNLWRGFAVDPRPGDCSLYLAHLRDNVCGGNAVYADYLLSWLAWGIQNPGDRAEVAVVLRGSEGTGKGMAFTHYGELFGPHYVHISQPSHLTGHFNAHLQACSVLFADEALFAGDRRHDGILKALITEPTIMIEPKGADSYAVRNALKVLMASNSEWVIPAGADARRFFVLDVSDAKKQDTRYFGAIARQMQGGGQEALLHHLMHRDLSTFDIRTVPMTEALQDQKARSRRGVDLLVELLAAEGQLPVPVSGHPDIALTSGEDRGEGFWPRARVLVPGLKHESSRVIQNTLKGRWGCRAWSSNGRQGLRFQPLAELRAAFDRRHGPQDWPEPAEWACGAAGVP